MRGVRVTPMLLVALLAGLAPGVAAAQPNLSGTWVLDKRQSVLESPRELPDWLPARADLTLVIAHEGPTLRIERRVRLMNLERSHTSIYYTDGREASNVTMRGQPVTSRSRWQGTALVTEVRVTNGSTAAGEEVLRLSEDGRMLTLEATRPGEGGDRPAHARLVFVRREASPSR